MSVLDLKKIRNKLGLKRQELAELLNISIETLNTWEYRDKKVPEDKVEYINSVINMYMSKIYAPNTVDSPRAEYDAGAVVVKGVPYFDFDFAGGWATEEIFSSVSPSFYIHNPEFQRCDFACNLSGYSISRRIPNNAIIGLIEIEDWQTYFPTNEIYAVIMKNDLRTVKIIKRDKTDKTKLILMPDPLPEHNITGYEAEEVPINFVFKFFQVKAWAIFENIAM
jgi:transcriptional regulator with XRE-family HTH domain